MGHRGCILPQGVFALLWPIIGSSFTVQYTTYPRIWVLRGNLITTYRRINNKSIQQEEYSTYSIKNQFKIKTVGSQTYVYLIIDVFSNHPFTKANMGRRECILPRGVFALLWPIIGSTFTVQYTTYPRIWVLSGHMITTYPIIYNRSIQQQEY